MSTRDMKGFRMNVSLLAGVGLLLLGASTAQAAPNGKPEGEASTQAAAAKPTSDAAKKPEVAPAKPQAKPAEVKSVAPAAPAPAPAPAPAADEPEVRPASDAKAHDGGWLDGEDGSAKAAAPAPATAPVPDSEPSVVEPKPAEPAPSPAPAPAAKAPALRYVIPESTEPASEPPPEDYEALPFTYHQLHWDLAAAMRVSFLRSEGYDYFSDNDALTQVSLTAGRALYAVDRFSFAVSGLFEAGGTEATTRGMKAEYTNQRFGLSLEGRYHLRHWLYAYLRVAPAAVRSVATLTPSQGTSYENETWGAGVDGALGLALRLFGSRDGRKSGARFFLFAEGGYGIAAEQDLSLTPTGNVTPDRAHPLDLGGLDASGAFMRFGATLTF